MEIQKCEYLENEKSLLDKIKNISFFLRGYHLVKPKNFLIIADISFKVGGNSNTTVIFLIKTWLTHLLTHSLTHSLTLTHLLKLYQLILEIYQVVYLLHL